MAKQSVGAIGKQLPDGKVIVDEICTCGHSIKSHEAGLDVGNVPGRGPCTGPLCKCTRFTWKKFITK